MAGNILMVMVAVFVSQWNEASSIAVPASTCVDKVACSLYGSSICTDPQYDSWTTANCAKSCNKCSGSPQTGEGKLMLGQQPTCVDSSSNCATYGKTMCDDVKFFTWVNENCQAYCGRCSNVCEDKVPNCADYGDSLCTDLSYYNWVEMHCRKFCARCTS